MSGSWEQTALSSTGMGSTLLRAPAGPRKYSFPCGAADQAMSGSWAKTALVLGGSTASGAGVGGLVGGKKGALVGAAIGGGAASIYEATRRR